MTNSRASRCALPSGTSPEARSRCLAALLALCACARDASAVRLTALAPREEIYRVECKRHIRACRDEAARACGGSYEVLESSGARVEPPRVTSAPGPASTGPRYQRPDWVGLMVVSCGAPAASAVEPAPAAPARVAPSLAPPPGRLCIPGVTQECLGPAACRGAQACTEDGDGYGPCDCGHGAANDGSARATPADASAGPRAR